MGRPTNHIYIYTLNTHSFLGASCKNRTTPLKQGVQAVLGTGLELTPKHCTMLISALGAVGLWRETVRALHEMKARGWAVNKVRSQKGTRRLGAWVGWDGVVDPHSLTIPHLPTCPKRTTKRR